MRYNKTNQGGLVYSTEFGTMCPGCSKPIAECVCRHNQSVPVGDGIVRVGFETKGRKGKGVTVISGLMMTTDELKDLAREFKTRCGTGGTVKEGTIEIQGDHRDRLIAELQSRGYTVRRK
jgi:translation initiation factor 1